MQHSDLVTRQFGSTAEAYLHSPTHASGDDLAALAAEVAEWSVARNQAPRVLDLGCGAGHVSFAVAPHAAAVVAYDMTAEMLAVVRQAAAERGLANIATEQGMVESLPFPDAHFDLVVSRFSAHHWHSVPAALTEARRVLTPGGRLIILDTAGGPTPLLDVHLQTIELLRDPSHLRNYSVCEWVALFEDAGLRPVVAPETSLELEFAAWIARMQTPEHRAAAILDVWAKAPEEVRSYFRVQPDGSFTLRKIRISATRPA